MKGEDGDIIPPAYAFRIMGSRGFWPLVSWSTTPKLGELPDPPAATLRLIQSSGQLNLASTAFAISVIAPGTAISSTSVQRQNPTGHELGVKPSVGIKQPQMFTFGPHPSTVTQQQQPYPYPCPSPLVIRPSLQYGARHVGGKSANSVPRYWTETDSQLISHAAESESKIERNAVTGSSCCRERWCRSEYKQSNEQLRPRFSRHGAVGDGRPRKSRTSILSLLTVEARKNRPRLPRRRCTLHNLARKLLLLPRRKARVSLISAKLMSST